MWKEPGAGGRQAHRVRAANTGKMEIRVITQSRMGWSRQQRPRLAGVCGEGGWEGGRREEPEETLSFFCLQSLRLRTVPTLCVRQERMAWGRGANCFLLRVGCP